MEGVETAPLAGLAPLAGATSRAPDVVDEAEDGEGGPGPAPARQLLAEMGKGRGGGGGRKRHELDVDAMWKALERLQEDPGHEDVVPRENYAGRRRLRNEAEEEEEEGEEVGGRRCRNTPRLMMRGAGWWKPPDPWLSTPRWAQPFAKTRPKERSHLNSRANAGARTHGLQREPRVEFLGLNNIGFGGWGEILLQIQPNLLTLNPFVDMELFRDDPVATVEVLPLDLFWGINYSLVERLLAIGPGFLSYGSPIAVIINDQSPTWSTLGVDLFEVRHVQPRRRQEKRGNDRD